MFQKFSCVLFPLVVWWPHISLCVMCVVYYSLCSWNLVLGPSLELIVAVAVLREAFSLLLGEPTWDHSKLACQLKISGQFSCSPTRMPFMGTNSHWQDLRLAAFLVGARFISTLRRVKQGVFCNFGPEWSSFLPHRALQRTSPEFCKSPKPKEPPLMLFPFLSHVCFFAS